MRILPAFSIALFLGIAACSSSSGTGASTTSGGTETTAEKIADGKAAVATRVCASCHQSTTNGSAGILDGLDADGPNLTPDADTGIGTWTDAEIIAAMRTGIDDEGEQLCSIMPLFTDMSDTEAANIVLYLRSLPAVSHLATDVNCGN